MSPRPPDALLAAAERLRWEVGDGLHDTLLETIYAEASRLAERAVDREDAAEKLPWERTLDRLLTSRLFGFPLMLLLLAMVFWITVAGANVPSAWLSALLVEHGHAWLRGLGEAAGLPAWLLGLLCDGAYLATAWVVAVMLPPMAIFFPLFTLLEDFGYLPRVAFNLDAVFRRVGAHGKQALSMTMGWGCNAAGVIATRIIDSPRERLIAILTNNFSLCNGRWPTQILISSLFIGALAPPALAGLVSAAAVVTVALTGIALTFLTAWFLSRTWLRGEASSFSLELPPFRPPRFLRTLYTSLIDRTLFVLGRAVLFALPAGVVIWLLSNLEVAGAPLAVHLAGWLEPFGLLVGLNGVILLAYVVAIPANEIVVPTILMLTALTARLGGIGSGAGVLFELDDPLAYRALFEAGGWTLLTAVNLMLFSLVHNPCSTTIFTIYRETGSVKWTTVATLLPLGMGFLLCFLVAQLWRLAALF
ncbi:MAG TPA: nucleoside recognition domain-containing protein [Thermoanaerobaculia bacterium]|nr:nucleoside recognition domain-containing protein [Thermoanaerobaculia bacterium]